MDFRVACASDFHFPIADSKAVDWFLSEAERFEANVIVLNGDFFEGEKGSKHPKDKDKAWSAVQEFKVAGACAAEINRRFPDAYKVLPYGNHCDNLLNYQPGRLSEQDYEELSDIKAHHFDPHVEDWHIIPEYSHETRWYLGQLCFQHGSETSKAGITKDIMDYCPYNGLLVQGHTHRPREVGQLIVNDVRAPFYSCNTGCMLDIPRAQYMKRMRKSNWGHGMLLAEVSAPGLKEGRKDYAKPRWKARVLIKNLVSQNYHDVSLTA